MQNIVDDFAEYLETITHYAPITVDNFQPTSQAIKIMIDPSSAVTEPYIDGSYTSTQSFTIMCRHDEQQKALEQCWAFYNALENVDIEIKEGVQIRTLSITRPSFVASTETGESDYAFTVEIELFKE